MNFVKYFLVIALSLIIGFPALAQETYEPSEERSDFDQRKQSIMDGNLLRATYHNTGHAGRRESGNLQELLFEYPRNTGREYMYFMSVMVGTLVPDQSTENPNDEFPMVDVASYRTSRDGTQNWSMNPIVGYQRDDSDEMARSDRGPESPLGNTWPDVWPDKLRDGGDGWAGSWNGFFGRDQFNADVEFYYKAGDDTYTRFSSAGRYQPDKTDPSRGGLGFIIDTRVLAWSQTLVNATHFNIFEVINDASYDYDQVAFGLWIADFVTGGQVSGDNPEFDDIRSIAYLTNENRNTPPANFDGPIGEMGIKFLETPGNSEDGIDNDGDSHYYNPASQYYDPDNKNLYTFMLEDNGGFFPTTAARDSAMPEFTAEAFDEQVLNPGDKIVRILEDGSRVIEEYPAGGGSIISQGIEVLLPAEGKRVVEDNFPQEDENFGVHIDGLDNDLDGLIDENIPNHLEKQTFYNNTEVTIAVQYINYLYFSPGDTLQPGLIVPNSWIRDRMNTDSEFAELVNDKYEGSFRNHFTAAVMIDEARDDYFDNDNDWEENLDDVGIQGNPNVFSEGQGDGKPSSGAGTTFPGEPNIDKTDVSESDLIGVSRVTIFDAGGLDVSLDSDIWRSYLIPGEFNRQVGTDSDIFVSSGLFPLRKGASERFAVAVTAAQTKSQTAQGDRDKINDNLEQADKAYQADYQFATAPTPPIVQAVAGDGKVTLYWDTGAENSFDRYINRITGDGNDFEGYKIYRATDDAFQDAYTITDATGNAQFYRPLAIIDKANGISGLHPIPINGVQFDMGDDTGLRRVFEDTDVVNGRKYFYAVTSFDFGLEIAGIAPSESPIQISRNPDGSVILGQNVVEVRPGKEQAGYISPDKPDAAIVSGSPGGTVEVDIVDPAVLKPDALYSVVFEDTLVTGKNNVNTLKTKNFSLINVSGNEPDTLIKRSENYNGESNPITEGFLVTLRNIAESGLNENLSTWIFNPDSTKPHSYAFKTVGAPKISDYNLIIGDSIGFGESIEKVVPVGNNMMSFPSIKTNFKVLNTYTKQEIDYVFADLNADSALQASPNRRAACDPSGFFAPKGYKSPKLGMFTAVSGPLGLCSDQVYFIEEFREVADTVTYRIELRPQLHAEVTDSIITANPHPGDTLKLFINKPFSANDEFRFRFDQDNVPKINPDSAKNALDDILVIPNPYIVSNVYEPRTTLTNKQHNRELHFTGMPAPSTLRIFTVSGVLVEEIQISPSDLTGGAYGGTYIWDMLTKDDLEISYGVYLYHVKAPGIGEKTGKFAVIK